jgi:hypothetical protein
MSKLQTTARALAPAIAVAAALTCGGGATAASLTEKFDVVGSTWSSWTQKNNSTNLGDYQYWNQGCSVTCPFSAHEGVPAGSPGEEGAFISVDYQSTRDLAGIETIDNWLIMPTKTFNNGDVLSFYTRTEANSPYADSLEVRFGAGAAPSPGDGTGSVGSFTTLLLHINPSLAVGAYPEAWTFQTATITGLSGATNGAIAFRYHIVDGGPGGLNSNVVGIDTVNITPAAPVPEPAVYLMMVLGLGAIGLRRMHAMRG